jgi:hypothetical protein
MPTRSTYNLAAPSFAVDPSSLRRSSGRQISWEDVEGNTEDGDPGPYGELGKRVIPAGTAVGDTLGSGKISPRVDTTNPAIGILETSAVEDSTVASMSGYGMLVGGVVYENLLAIDSGDLSDVKEELADAGCTFQYEEYEDSRTS